MERGGGKGMQKGRGQDSLTRGTASVPLSKLMGWDVGDPQLEDSCDAALKGVDVELELRAQGAPQVDDDAPCAVQAGLVQLAVLVILVLLHALELHTSKLVSAMWLHSSHFSDHGDAQPFITQHETSMPLSDS